MTARKLDKVPVSERALLQRVNRKLADDLEVIKRAKPVRAYVEQGYADPYPLDTGKFYRVDYRRNFMVEKDVDLEALAREIGALKAWEELAPEGE